MAESLLNFPGGHELLRCFSLCHPLSDTLPSSPKARKGKGEGEKKSQVQLCFLFKPQTKEGHLPACSQTSSSLMGLISLHPSCIDSSCCPSSRMNYISLFHLSRRLLRSLSASSGSNRASTAKTCRPESYSDLIRLKIFPSRTLLFLMV